MSFTSIVFISSPPAQERRLDHIPYSTDNLFRYIHRNFRKPDRRFWFVDDNGFTYVIKRSFNPFVLNEPEE